MLAVAGFLSGLAGCGSGGHHHHAGSVDADGDGYPAGDGGADDCDDANADANPGAEETCDGVDNDCDGGVDEGMATTPWYYDNDLDRYGDPATALDGCRPPAGYVANGLDCDDTDPDLNPGEQDVPGDGVDQDCDGLDAIPTLQDLAVQYTGDMWNGGVAEVVAGAGDVNADGFDDILVTASLDDVGGAAAGAVHLVLGSASPAAASLDAVGAKYTGKATYDRAGSCVAAAGDMNADGFDDILIGADGVNGPGLSAGAAYVIFGTANPASASLAEADVFYPGVGDFDSAGFWCSGAGDVNADGFDDVLIASWGSDDRGAAHLVLGSASPAPESLSVADATYTGEEDEDLAGWSMSAAGDVDADGLDDMLIASPWNAEAGTDAGAAYLVLGDPAPVSSGLSDAAAKYSGEEWFDDAGSFVAAAGDVNADGYADVLVGADSNSNGTIDSGTTYLILGTPDPRSLSLSVASAEYTGVATGDLAGVSGAGPGDLDDDGFDDLLLGASQESGIGAAFVVLGAAAPASRSLADADVKHGGVRADDQVGASVSGAGDVNADGALDLLVGAPGDDVGAGDAGAAYLVLR